MNPRRAAEDPGGDPAPSPLVSLLTAPASAEAPPAGRSRRPLLLVLAGIALVAFLVRLQLTVRGGGLLGIGAYDDGVHYAAASSLIHGRLPYRDFLFLQPPAMALAASPFAAIGQVLGDPIGLRLLRLAFMAVGAANAVLVALVLRRWGAAALVTGGLAYAVFFPAVYDERTALLEPAGTAGILLALLLTARGREAGTRSAVVAGIALGAACGFKIWYVVPALVVLGFAHRRLRVLAGAVVAGLVIYLPFFAAAPQRMWQQVVLAQVGRGRSEAPDELLQRARVLLGAAGIHREAPVPGLPIALLTAVLLVLLVAAAVIAVLTPGARVIVALLLVDGAVVLASPSFFAHYAALTAPVLVLLLGVAVGRLVPLLRRRGLRIAATAVVLVCVAGLNARHDLARVDVRPPGQALQQAAARTPGCIVSDDPTLLAVMDVVRRDLAEGCPLRVDTGGYSFGPDRQTAPDGEPVSRKRNTAFQASTVAYLLDSDAFIRWRKNTALDVESLERLREQPVIAVAGRFTLRAGTR